MNGTKQPFEYEARPSDRESHLQNSQWYTIRLKNLSDDTLDELEVGLHLVNSKGQENVEWLFFGSLVPNESKTLSLLVQASDVAHAYLSVSGQENNRIFHWNNEVGEVVDKKDITQETIEAKIAQLKEQYVRDSDAFDKRCQENEENVWEWLTGHEPVEKT
jgi:uncharacterized phage infection (PIP) family protein YhgE